MSQLGLDADRIDGLDSTAFLPADGDVLITGDLEVLGNTIFEEALTSIPWIQRAWVPVMKRLGRVYFNTDQQRFKDAMEKNGSTCLVGPATQVRPEIVSVNVDGVLQWSYCNFSASCREYLRDPNYFGGGDGKHRINNGERDLVVYCDMTTDGGGWTMVGHYRHPANQNSVPGHDNRDYALFMRAHINAAIGQAQHFAEPTRGPDRLASWKGSAGPRSSQSFSTSLNSSLAGKITVQRQLPSEKSFHHANRGTNQPVYTGNNLMYKLHPAED